MMVEDEFINQFILWKPLKIVSLIIYLFIIVLLPFNQFWSTILLFGLIALWSRVPALTTMYLNDIEIIDFFEVMIAIHVGGLFAGIFGSFLMLFSRIFGPREWLPYTIKDAICLFFCGLATPFVYAATGSPLYSLYIFTAIRYTLYLLLTLIFEPQEFLFELWMSVANSVVAVLSNTFVMKLFEGTLNRVFERGLSFSFELFFFTTIIIGGFYLLSKAGKWYEKWRMKRVEAGLEEEYQPPIWMLDAESKPLPQFVKTG